MWRALTVENGAKDGAFVRKVKTAVRAAESDAEHFVAGGDKTHKPSIVSSRDPHSVFKETKTLHEYEFSTKVATGKYAGANKALIVYPSPASAAVHRRETTDLAFDMLQTHGIFVRPQTTFSIPHTRMLEFLQQSTVPFVREALDRVGGIAFPGAEGGEPVVGFGGLKALVPATAQTVMGMTFNATSEHDAMKGLLYTARLVVQFLLETPGRLVNMYVKARMSLMFRTWFPAWFDAVRQTAAALHIDAAKLKEVVCQGNPGLFTHYLWKTDGSLDMKRVAKEAAADAARKALGSPLKCKCSTEDELAEIRKNGPYQNPQGCATWMESIAARSIPADDKGREARREEERPFRAHKTFGAALKLDSMTPVGASASKPMGIRFEARNMMTDSMTFKAKGGEIVTQPGYTIDEFVLSAIEAVRQGIAFSPGSKGLHGDVIPAFNDFQQTCRPRADIDIADPALAEAISEMRGAAGGGGDAGCSRMLAGGNAKREIEDALKLRMELAHKLGEVVFATPESCVAYAKFLRDPEKHVVDTFFGTSIRSLARRRKFKAFPATKKKRFVATVLALERAFSARAAFKLYLHELPFEDRKDATQDGRWGIVNAWKEWKPSTNRGKVVPAKKTCRLPTTRPATQKALVEAMVNDLVDHMAEVGREKGERDD